MIRLEFLAFVKIFYQKYGSAHCATCHTTANAIFSNIALQKKYSWSYLPRYGTGVRKHSRILSKYIFTQNRAVCANIRVVYYILFYYILFIDVLLSLFSQGNKEQQQKQSLQKVDKFKCRSN